MADSGVRSVPLNFMQTKRNSGYTIVELIVVVFMLGLVALAGVGIYILIHFLMKLW